MTFWVAGAVVAGNVVSSVKTARARRTAAQDRLRAIQEAKDITKQQYDVSKGYIEPYYNVGTASSNRLGEMLGVTGDTSAPGYGSLMKPFAAFEYSADPGYAFRLAEGTKALERSAAARGGLLSGGALRETQRYGQGLASQEYQNAYSRYKDAYDRYMAQNLQQYNMLAQQQGRGYTAGTALSDLSSGYGANIANLTLGGGNVRAESVLGQQSAYTQGVNSLINAVGNYMSGGMKTPSTSGGVESGLPSSSISGWSSSGQFESPYDQYGNRIPGR